MQMFHFQQNGFFIDIAHGHAMVSPLSTPYIFLQEFNNRVLITPNNIQKPKLNMCMTFSIWQFAMENL